MKFLLSGLSVFPASPERVIELAQETEFDGVELLLAGKARRNPEKYSALSRKAGMTIHFHQGWTSSEATSPSLIWKLMEILRYLPNDGMSFLDKVPSPVTEPVVVYANEFGGATQPNHWLQTISVMDGKKFKMLHRDFLEGFVREPKGGIVFDIFHDLEWYLGHTRSNLSKAEILERLTKDFQGLKPWVKEIHLADYSRQLGRNCLLGSGLLPIREFCVHVKQSGWDGTVTPEVHPKYFLFNRKEKLRAMLATAKKFFEQ